MAEFGRRLKQAADIIGGLDALSPHLSGVSRRTLSDWANDKTEPRASSIAEICDKTGVSIQWLITGQGEMLAIDRLSPQRQSLVDVALDRPDFVTLPVFNEIRASAGPSAVVPASEQADGVVAFARQFLHDQGASPDHCSIIWARGTSMKPTIPDGSVLVVDHSQRDVENGCIYVFNVCDRLLVKRARWRMDGRLELVSDNKTEDYPIETFGPSEADDLRVVGRVVYFCRTP